jgi:hypothetical protein
MSSQSKTKISLLKSKSHAQFDVNSTALSQSQSSSSTTLRERSAPQQRKMSVRSTSGGSGQFFLKLRRARSSKALHSQSSEIDDNELDSSVSPRLGQHAEHDHRATLKTSSESAPSTATNSMAINQSQTSLPRALSSNAYEYAMCRTDGQIDFANQCAECGAHESAHYRHFQAVYERWLRKQDNTNDTSNDNNNNNNNNDNDNDNDNDNNDDDKTVVLRSLRLAFPCFANSCWPLSQQRQSRSCVASLTLCGCGRYRYCSRSCATRHWFATHRRDGACSVEGVFAAEQ